MNASLLGHHCGNRVWSFARSLKAFVTVQVGTKGNHWTKCPGCVEFSKVVNLPNNFLCTASHFIFSAFSTHSCARKCGHCKHHPHLGNLAIFGQCRPSPKFFALHVMHHPILGPNNWLLLRQDPMADAGYETFAYMRQLVHKLRPRHTRA